MDLYTSYLMMNALSGLNSTYPAGNLLSGTSSSNAASTISFLNILQSLQNLENSSGAANASNASVIGSSSAPSSRSSSNISAGSDLDAIFEKAAERYNVNVNLLKAIGKAESNFNASAVSSAGAIGVMQLMPGTARSLGVTDPYNAEQNIMGGAQYIAKMLDRYDGDIKLALAAYNAGPGNVDKYDGIPPFKETQNYVKRVLEYMDGDTATAYGGSAGAAVQTTDETAVSNTASSGTITLKTETLVTLYNLMRAQMELQLASSMFAWNNDDSSNSNGLFSL